PELDGLHRLLDVAAHLGVRIDLERVLEAQLAGRLLELGRIVREHLPAAKRLVLSGGPIDRHAHVDVLAVALARRGREGGCGIRARTSSGNSLLVLYGIEQLQNLFALRAPLCSAVNSGTNLPSAISASSARQGVQSTSVTIVPSSMASSRPFRRLRPSR